MTDTETTRPRLGDFSKPTAPRAHQSAEEALQSRTDDPLTPSKEEQEEALLSQIDSSEETPVEQEAKKRLSLYEEMQQALLPVQDYKKFLAEHDISEDEAEEIVDNLVTKGYHEEEFPISRRRSVTFRTREHRDLLRLQVMFQVQQPVFQGTIDEMTVRYNMAASMVSCIDQKFEFATLETPDKEADALFDKRMEYVERMPDPLFSKLSVKLAVFDRKISAVMREGVAENF
ncbi:MAG: hypothetical protein ACYTEQ_15195 [Planctomycetota bacterium]